MSELCQKLKQIPIPEILARETGDYSLTGANRDKSAACPCGSDKDKNHLRFYPATNSFFCHVGNVGGSPIDFIKHIRGVDTDAAIEYLKNHYLDGVIVTPIQREQVQPPTPPIEYKQDTEIYNYLLDLCAGNHDTEVETYLDGRGITAEVRERYKIRIIPAGQGVTDTRAALVKKFGLERVRAAGLISVSGWFVFSNHRLLLPAMQNNKCLYLSGRVTDTPAGTGTATPTKYRYLSGLERVPFLLDNLQTARGKIYLVEGFFDAIAATLLDRPAIALGSCNYKKDLYKYLLQRIAAKGLSVVFAFDNDNAGQSAINREIEKGLTVGEYCQTINLQAFKFDYKQDLQGCKDWNDYYIYVTENERKRADMWLQNTMIDAANPPDMQKIVSDLSAAIDAPKERALNYINSLTNNHFTL